MKIYPKISIITPSYNQGQFIEETILSLLNQNYPNLEYIIIDGGSTDNTIEIIKKYEKKINFWVSESDRGQSHAINKGLKHCTGEVFNWLNSDDFLAPGALFIIGEAFENSEVDVLCGYCNVFSSGGQAHVYRMGVNATTEDTIIDWKMCQPSTFFRLERIKELGINESLHYAMDLNLWFNYLTKFGQKKVLITNELLSNFRLHDDGKSATQNPFKSDGNAIEYSLCINVGIPKKSLMHLTHSKNENYENEWNFNNLKKNEFVEKWYEYNLNSLLSQKNYRHALNLLISIFTKKPKLIHLKIFFQKICLPLIKSKISYE